MSFGVHLPTSLVSVLHNRSRLGVTVTIRSVRAASSNQFPLTNMDKLNSRSTVSADSPQRFFIIGAQKAGTTSLYEYLATHPDIFASPIKETKFFLNPTPTTENENSYRSMFAGRAAERWAFEASPHYTQYPRYQGVPARIHATFPQARLIYILRHPIDRIYSHYLFRLSKPDKGEQRSFDEAIDANPLYLDTSRYHLQLTQYLGLFPPTHILVVFFEELVADPRTTVKRIFDFLAVDSTFVPPNLDRVYRETKDRTMVAPGLRRLRQRSLYNYLPWRVRDWARRRFRTRPPTTAEIFTPDSYNRLHQLLLDDVARLQDYVGRDLPWDFPRSKFE